MIKKSLLVHVILIVLFSAFPIFAEEIQHYHVDMHLNRDASVSVTETINYDFGDAQKHGIYRFIPVTFTVEGQEKWYGLQQRKLKFEKLSILRDGKSEPYTVEKKDTNGNYFIKIGNPNKTISGTHQYTIQYKVLGSLRYFDDYDELYWNAIGLDWDIPIDTAEVFLTSDHIPFQQFSCYAGSLGQKKSCTQEDKNAYELLFSSKWLAPHEGMTVAASFPKEMVPRVEYFVWSLKGLIAMGIGVSLFFFAGVWYIVRKFRRKYFVYDPIHPRYTPPQDIDPIFAGYCIDMQLQARDISAEIIQLARDGYLNIEKKERNSFWGDTQDYLFTLKKKVEGENTIAKVQKLLLQVIFSKTQNIVVLLERIAASRGKVDSQCTIGEQTLLSIIAKRNNRTQYSLIETTIKNYCVSQGFLEERSQKKAWVVLIPFFLTLFAFRAGYPILGFAMFFISFITIFAIVSTQVRYTKKGWEMKHALEGFKLFLSMTEKERYEFFNDPADNPQEFMEYLPYAIAFGVEKKWAKQFRSLTISQPDWYRGSSPLVATAFVDEMVSLSRGVGSAIATKASSGSGSGGGGFSGGGAGGGGGGSW